MRRVYYALITDGRLDKNPARNLGRMMRGVQNAAAKQTALREAWTHAEAATLIDLARAHEARFAPFLELLFATGLRRGEALGLQWSDISFDERTLTVSRSITSQGVSTPKSGRSRRVVMTESLTETLFDVLGDRQRERLALGWRETPAWVFCSETGTAPDPRNAARIWDRVRRCAQKEGVRGLPLHSARHSWATWALQARKPVQWVADQLGHADASTTLNHYAHAMPEYEADLSFLDLDVARRRYPSPDEDTESEEPRNPAKEWCARQDSNLRTSAPQADALSI